MQNPRRSLQYNDDFNNQVGNLSDHKPYGDNNVNLELLILFLLRTAS